MSALAAKAPIAPQRLTHSKDLARAVCAAYAATPDASIDNKTLYQRVAEQLSLPLDTFSARQPVGPKAEHHCVPARVTRWVQQSLKKAKLIERTGARGEWKLTAEGKHKLLRPTPGKILVAFSTRLGVAMLADNRDVLDHLDEPITLSMFSPPYLKRDAMAYGHVAETEADYIDFICGVVERICRNLRPGGSIVINLGNDVFEEGLPSRSIYLERLTIALHDRCGLSLMDRIVWESNKLPSPTMWACRKKIQMVSTYEPILWLCNDPSRVRADTRRIYQPHTKKHLKLMAQGGEQRNASASDGSHIIRAGRSFARSTPGRLQRNILKIGNHCRDQVAYKAAARRMGLITHGAVFPLKLARTFIDMLCQPGELFVEPFFGSGTSCKAAELAGVRWLGMDNVAQYVRGGATRFEEFEGYWMNPNLDRALFGTGEALLYAE